MNLLVWALVLSCQTIGQWWVMQFKWPLPGSLLGMMILWLLMYSFPRLYQQLLPTTNEVVKLIPLFFVPVGVGIGEIAHVSEFIFGVVLSVITTLLVGVATAATFVGITRWHK